MKNLLIRLTVLLFLGITPSGFAHHASAPHFDESKEIVLEGTVTQWRFVNPHSYIYFDVSDENGVTENWRCEMHARTPMQRNGFTDETFVVGQKLTLIGAPARREDNVCGLTSFKFADGTEIARNGALPAEYQVGKILEQESIAIDKERAEYLENGQPNISGYWVRAARGGGPTTVQREGGAAGGMGAGGMGAGANTERPAGGMAGGMGRGGTQYDLTQQALAKQATYEQIYDNPSIQCDITNIFFGWTHDANVNQVTQEDNKITLLYGYMDFVRTIHLGMDEHPDNIVPSRGGHSIGHWDDKTLVVDTVGFTPGVFNPLNGEPHSPDMHTIEKFWYDADAKTLNRSYTIEDPANLNTPFTNQDSLIMSDVPYSPYACVELSGDNNRRPE